MTLYQEKVQFEKTFIDESVAQMKDLKLRRDAKVYLASKLLEELSTIMTWKEVTRVLYSNEIKWDKIQHRYYD